ncbi:MULTISPECIES: DASS family sodium-coupled anion symporter [unclassified Actinobaculum]|uniref:SLC13 family permease n=1 Tax=unclassified Actinobaculum TaxID=2609299 RepID=UPI000D52A450|nr:MULTISPECIES: DASS family sodium-coupled anion symporter [unclassified Actinobaculum]AWE41477.1 transporter [Actinobaculum sp. 313]RTE48186.1 SLC13/DASS family transporter [Actinobaculum sp. 352]
MSVPDNTATASSSFEHHAEGTTPRTSEPSNPTPEKAGATASTTPVDAESQEQTPEHTGYANALSTLPPQLTGFQIGGLVIGIIAFLFPFFIDIPNLAEPGERMLSIFLLAIVFWITEAIPLTATAVLVILLEVLLISQSALSDPTGGDPELVEAALPAANYFAALANPVIILFLGGFLIAHGAEKYGLDKNIAAVLLRPFTGSARITVLGLMVITALMSMFMSNTATTATMFAVVIPIIGALPEGRARTGVALSIPLAANVGGIGTPVGTPPNAIAVSALAERGIHVSFIHWMGMAVPFMLIVLVASWLLLCTLYIPREARIAISVDSAWNTSRPAALFYIVAGTTIVLWMTEPIHQISSNTIGFFPVVALLCLRVMDGRDLGAINWAVLWLVSGGIALGNGIGASGLDAWLVGSINWENMSAMLVIAVLGFIGLGFANVMSHSAASNLLVPLAVSLATALAGTSVIAVAATVAIACSLGMSLPISTPPNAIAYSTGEISVKQMAIVGIIVGVAGTALLVFALPTVWSLLGLA